MLSSLSNQYPWNVGKHSHEARALGCGVAMYSRGGKADGGKCGI